MKVEITPVLDQASRDAYIDARNAATAAYDASVKADGDAFMALMAQIGVDLGDRVVISKKDWNGRMVSGDAILVQPRKFMKVKKDGTVSQFEYHTYGSYAVEKFNPPA